ncbi:hypothetical protein ECHLIB_0550 [Ehrlichia chaffeensis str. Liberty]|uniref:Uncharacterized protein n=1 Tax=Ehrlichia chaffeensis (strain ATCC CRL-10679 / Arkansas) TaxID=205920 RepID=Q2GGP4_EHRCR|nr:hypothetical protein [Ehrlichia chaffeensis]ABD44895.1 hypothetical protein ECH_0578 [Ehrlichia chaffeensis str. Arkansas]AHX05612.1 hypothetical protein ECHJAX_0548 [Ehrlichia chaffeensis str. Jax]AHX06603.1 hypothetical protein ECHLIB_0550 [Ehrlichia chaffeensis str. Liberty]AHX07088.1 hypothetical protein ECHOSC_0516 [Ehrlichia chaffeensis str. Osceola]AHX08461.1 hypothetical protein ECHSTV_0537 [Ehrlichia chaffeensis str. Saint Vincent]
MIFHIDGVDADKSKLLNKLITHKNYIWFYRSICIGIITTDNKFVLLKDESIPFYYEQQVVPSYIFFMKGREEGVKVWHCVLIKGCQVSQFVDKTSIIINMEKERNPIGIIVHICDIQDYGEIIYSGIGKMSMSNFKKNLKDICKSSANPQLSTVTFPISYWSKLVQNVVEIIPMQKINYTRINNN